MISIIFGLDLLPIWMVGILAALEIVLLIYWVLWKIDTREYPKMHYRAFRRIECMAPNNWTPDYNLAIGVVIYSGHGKWQRFAMKTFPEALICWIWYAKVYWRHERRKEENSVMRGCVECWKRDVADYQKQAEAQIVKAAKENEKIDHRNRYWSEDDTWDE